MYEQIIFPNSGNAARGTKVSALAGNTFTGQSGLPQPVAFGDGNSSTFFKPWSGAPTFTTTVGSLTQQQLCFTFQVDSNEVVLIDSLAIWIDSVNGSPIDQMRLSIQTLTGGSGTNPSGTILDYAVFTPSNSPSQQGAALNGGVLELTAGFYAFVVDRTGSPSGTTSWTVGTNNFGGTNNSPFLFNGTSWSTNDRQPNLVLSYTYAKDTAYLAAPSTGHRMESVIQNSGSGNTYKDTIPSILQTSIGFTNHDDAIGDMINVIISGAVAGFTGLTIGKYVVANSNGTIVSGGSGNIVGRALLSTTIEVLPQ